MSFQRGRDPVKVLELGKYIYDNGFGPRWYVCGNHVCRGIRMERRVKGGFQPPDYICHDCGHITGSPPWINLDPKTGEPIEGNKVKYFRIKNTI